MRGREEREEGERGGGGERGGREREIRVREYTTLCLSLLHVQTLD